MSALTQPLAELLPLEPDGVRRMHELLRRVPIERLREYAAALRQGSLDRGVFTERDGQRVDIDLTLRPRLMDLRSHGYVHHVAWHLRTALRRVSRLVFEDERVRAVLPLSEGERPWIERYRGKHTRAGARLSERIFCRLDALARFEGHGWHKTLRFIETNVVGVGGMRYTGVAEDLMLELLVPLLLEQDDEVAFARNGDPRQLLLDELLEHARALGVQGAPTIAFVDDKSLYQHGGEFARLVPHYQGRGVNALYADARELEASQTGEVSYQGQRVDIVYRFLELRELAEIETEAGPLTGLRAAFAQNRVVPTAGGDIEHKSTFHVLTDEAFRPHFTKTMQRIFDAHVPWTRLLEPAHSKGPDGAEVDLPEYARVHRESLVLKPNRGYGGEGVVIGASVSDSTWHDALERALREPREFIVQAVAEPDVEAFPVIDDAGELKFEPYYAVVGLYPGRNGLGVFGRVAQGRVVNIHVGGGISPFLVDVA